MMHMPEIDFNDIDSRIDKASKDALVLDERIKALTMQIEAKTAQMESLEAVAKYADLEEQRKDKLHVSDLYGDGRYITLRPLLGHQSSTAYTMRVDELKFEIKSLEAQMRNVEAALTFLNDDIVLLRKIQNLGGNPLLRRVGMN